MSSTDEESTERRFACLWPFAGHSPVGQLCVLQSFPKWIRSLNFLLFGKIFRAEFQANQKRSMNPVHCSSSESQQELVHFIQTCPCTKAKFNYSSPHPKLDFKQNLEEEQGSITGLNLHPCNRLETWTLITCKYLLLVTGSTWTLLDKILCYLVLLVMLQGQKTCGNRHNIAGLILSKESEIKGCFYSLPSLKHPLHNG